MILMFSDGELERYCLLGCDAVLSDRNSMSFRKNVVSPSSRC
jgi:hypothetical protein